LLIDGGTAINLMSYSIFKKLGWEDDELMKTNQTLNGVGGNLMEARGIISMELTVGASLLLPHFFSSRCKIIIVLFLAAIEFTPVVAFPLHCTTS
jgi:hypothetical protein